MPWTHARFELEAPIAKGGHGEVYRGRDRQTGRRVAIKVVAASRPMRRRQRLLSEAVTLTNLHHPSLPYVIDHGCTEEGSAYLVLDFVEGETLEATLRSRRLTLDETQRIILRLAHALSAMHSRGVIHRDVSAANVVLGPNGQVTLLDLGIARVEADPRSTQDGDLLGTPAYMAPEQARGDQVDGRTDLYALGILFYFCVFGRLPFESTSVAATLVKQLLEPPPRLRPIGTSIPPQLEDLIFQMLEKEPGDRPQTSEEVIARLQANLDAGPSQAARPSSWTLRLLVGVVALSASLGAAFAPGPGASAPPKPTSLRPIASAHPAAGAKPQAAYDHQASPAPLEEAAPVRTKRNPKVVRPPIGATALQPPAPREELEVPDGLLVVDFDQVKPGG